jgi:hypothetical protein
MSETSPTPPPDARPGPTPETPQTEDRAAVLEVERLARAQARVGQAVRGAHETS